jgi:hypothetical protein
MSQAGTALECLPVLALVTEPAHADAQGKEAEAEEARRAARDLAGRRANLFAEARAAEEGAIAARQRIPELEAQKRAAAAARVITPSTSPLFAAMF